MKNTVLHFGAISGLILVTLSAISYLTIGTDPNNYELSEFVGYTSMVLSLAIIFFAVIHHKKKHGHISFGQGFVIGLGISTIAALLFAIFDVLYTTVIEPDFMTNYMGYYAEQIKNNPNLSEADKVAQLIEMESYADMSPIFMGFIMFITVWMIGIIMTLVAAMIIKSKNKTATGTL